MPNQIKINSSYLKISQPLIASLIHKFTEHFLLSDQTWIIVKQHLFLIILKILQKKWFILFNFKTKIKIKLLNFFINIS